MESFDMEFGEVQTIHGKDGADGKDGIDGKDGESAYEIAVRNGFEGTEEEWLESLKGEDGKDGGGGGGLTQAQVDAIYGLLKIAAYTEDATEAHQAFLDAFACHHEYDNACDAECNLCGAVRDTAHSYGEGVVTQEPDYGVDGVMTYTCTICGATKTEVIPALVPPVITATYSPKTPQGLRVNFDYDTDDADAIRNWLTVTDEDGNTITDYTLSKNADGDVVVSYHGATATVEVERNTFAVLGGGVDIVRGSSNNSYSKQGAGFP